MELIYIMKINRIMKKLFLHRSLVKGFGGDGFAGCVVMQLLYQQVLTWQIKTSLTYLLIQMILSVRCV